MATETPPGAIHQVERGWILGFDIGGTKTAVVAGTAEGTVLDRLVSASDAAGGFGPMWERMTAAADRLTAARGQPRAIGVSIGGPLDHARGIVLSPPNLPGWDRIPLGDLLGERFGVPVYVEHDAKSGLLAEWLFGAAQGCSDAIFLTLGTGLGCGVMAGGRLIRGARDAAGEVGHWRMAEGGPLAYGKAGSWEAFSSGAGLPRLAADLYPGRWPDTVTAEELVGLARSGDEAASTVVERSAAWLGRGVAQLVDLLDPQVVVLGALAWRAADLYLPTVRRIVAVEASPRDPAVRIEPAHLAERLGDVAARAAAIHHGSLGHTPTAGV
jgi:glucokinase